MSTELPTACQSEINPIRTLLFKHARDAFVGPRSISRQWQALNYTGPPDFDHAVRESDRFCDLLEGLGVELVPLPHDPGVGLDSIYPRDAAVIRSRGVILCRMGKAARSQEPAVLQRAVEGLGLPVAGAIEGEGRLEGGDIVWLDSRLAYSPLLPVPFRTREQGVHHFHRLLAESLTD